VESSQFEEGPCEWGRYRCCPQSASDGRVAAASWQYDQRQPQSWTSFAQIRSRSFPRSCCISLPARRPLLPRNCYWHWDPVTAEGEYKGALELNPNVVQGHHWYATFLLTSRRFPEALEQIEQARKLDPSSTTIQADKAKILYDAGRKNEAFALLQQLEMTDPTLATTHTYLAEIYFARKDYESSFAESKQAA